MSTVTTGKTTCPLCGAAGCTYGHDFGAFLFCSNPQCPPNALHGRVSDWYVTGSEADKILSALFPEEEV